MENIKKFQLMDITSLIYFGLLSLTILFFHKGLKNWGVYIIGHSLFILIILCLVWLSEHRRSKILALVRDWYPALLIIFCFEEMDSLVTIIFPYWANQFVMKLDKAIFGVYPTVWLERIANPWLTEMMVFFLSVYFLMLPVGGGVLYFRGKKNEFYALMFNVVLAYFISYYLFLFFPAEGPWVIMTHYQTKPLEGKLLFDLYYSLQKNASIRGGCFPSSHVAGAFAVALSLFRSERKLFYGLLIVATGIAFSTIYSRYHHAVDSLAGILIGVICVLIGSRLSQSWEAKRRQ